MSKRKHRKRIEDDIKNFVSSKICHNCGHCIYVGEGGYICDMSNDLVIVDWQPTDEFMYCDGEDFEKI